MRRVLRGATARTFVVQPRPPKRRLLELTLVRHGQSEGNLAYRRAGQGDDCEPNSFDPSTEANGYWTSSFTIPDFSWDRCSSALDLTDSTTWSIT